MKICGAQPLMDFLLAESVLNTAADVTTNLQCDAISIIHQWNHKISKPMWDSHILTIEIVVAI